jgi:hypothetical protein
MGDGGGRMEGNPVGFWLDDKWIFRRPYYEVGRRFDADSCRWAKPTVS